jgi:hypothetical protein
MATTKAHDLARLLADGVVGTTEIGDSQVTTAKIADGSITTDKLATNAVTAAKVNIDAADVPYDNTTSGISANTLQEAIDYLNIATGGGSAGAQATYTRDKFVATEGQTTFTTTNGYTLGYVQVFMNGILLDITDYAAGDESTVVLSTGARAGDEIVVIAYDSFAISEVLRVLNVSASFPDDGLTLDANGNMDIGQSGSFPGAGNTTTGHRLASDGRLFSSTSDSSYAANFNVNDNGDIIRLRRAGTSVGAISVSSNDNIHITATSGGGAGLQLWGGGGTDPIVSPMKEGVVVGGEVDLGRGTEEFRNLYLTGGVYIGGYGGANHLDDYEEGTWTPSVGSGTVAPYVGSSHYIKVGRLVTVFCRLQNFSDTSSGTAFELRGLPFTVDAGNTCHEAHVGEAWGDRVGEHRSFFLYSGVSNATKVTGYYGSAGANSYNQVIHSNFGSGVNLLFRLQYFTT